MNPLACDGVGICGHLAAELVRFDSWGFPIVTDRALLRRDFKLARAAVAACPRQALFIQDSRP
ncbi:MAG: ferredoxin [Pseudonocardiales bacterium]